MADFAIELRTLAAKCGWNTEALVTSFHQGLSNSIKYELVALELGEDLESQITLEIRVDNRIREQVRQCPFDTSPLFRFPEHPKPTEWTL